MQLPNISAQQRSFGLLQCATPTFIDSFVAIRNPGSDTLKIASLNVTGPHGSDFVLLDPFTPTVAILPGDSIQIRLRFTPSGPGLRQGFLHVESNAANYPFYDVPLNGRLERTELSLSQRTFDLGMMCPKEKRDIELLIKNSGTILTSMQMTAQLPVQLSLTTASLRPNDSLRLLCSILAPDQEGTFTSFITIRDHCDRIDTIWMSGNVALPHLALDPLVISATDLSPRDTILTIRNIGARTISFSQWNIGDSRFTILFPQVPIQIPPGSSIEIQLRYTPTDTSSFQTSFMAQGTPCNLDVQSIISVTNSPKKFITVASTSHGTLRCEVFRDTMVTIRNFGLSPLRILSAMISGFHSSDFILLSPASIPPELVILPNNSENLVIRFIPNFFGNRSADLTIVSDADNTPLVTIPLRGRKEDIRFALSDTLLDFGMLCPSTQSTQNLSLSNTGTTLVSVSLSASSQFLLSQPTLILNPTESRQIQIQFNGQATEGIVNGSLIATDECFGEKRVQFRARVETPRLTANPISFNTFVSAIDVQNISLRNSSNHTMVINIWSIPDPRFRITSPQLPKTILPNDSIDIRIEFTPTNEDSITTNLIIRGEPCSFASNVNVAATAFQASAVVSLPVVQADVDTSISIPIILQSSQNLLKSGASSYRMQLSFNRTLLLPVGVRTSAQSSQALITSNTTDDSLRIIDIDVIGTTPPTPGTILYLDCIAGLGNAESTPLTIRQFTWTNAKVTTTTLNGSFTSTGICREGGTRLLKIPLSAQLFQNFPNPFSLQHDHSTTIQFSIHDESHVVLKMYDIFGREAATLVDAQLAMGLHTIQLRPIQLRTPIGTGLYVYTLTSGGEILMKKMLVIQ